MKTFCKINENPKEVSTSDCVVRALAYVEKTSWDDIYDELCKMGKEEKRMPNDRKLWTSFIENRGWLKAKMPKRPDNTRFKLNDYLQEFKNRVVLVKTSGHLTVVDDGVIVDTWDCGEWCMGNYWFKA